MDEATTTLYRPVGQRELDLIAAADWRSFPPRLPQQPIFYPVLTEEYATKIARDWNTSDAASGYVGYVTRFTVPVSVLDRWPPQQGAAGQTFRELWVPSDELDDFNDSILGKIEVIAEYRGAPPSPPSAT